MAVGWVRVGVGLSAKCGLAKGVLCTGKSFEHFIIVPKRFAV